MLSCLSSIDYENDLVPVTLLAQNVQQWLHPGFKTARLFSCPGKNTPPAIVGVHLFTGIDSRRALAFTLLIELTE